MVRGFCYAVSSECLVGWLAGWPVDDGYNRCRDGYMYS
jgi:hypothetical protein